MNTPLRWTLTLALLTLLVAHLPAEETNSVSPKRPDVEQDPGWQLVQRLAEAYASPTNHQTTIQLHGAQAEADKGVPAAQFAIGMLRFLPVYTNGVVIPEDHAEAARWLKKAADQGHPFAQAALAPIYERGDGVPKDTAAAVKLYRLNAEQGFQFAQVKLCRLYEEGKLLPKDDAQSLNWLRKAATDNDEPAVAFKLAEFLLSGTGTRTNPAEALRWYQKAAQPGGLELSGFGPAQLRLGQMYEDGTAVPKNPAEAGKWYRKSIEWQKWYGTNAFGVNHFYPEETKILYGETPDWSTYLQQLKTRLEQADANTLFDFGNHFYVCDPPERVKWLRRAAEKGHAEAALYLSSLLSDGDPQVQQDLKEALKWCLVATDHDFVEAQLRLGMWYYEGKGVPKDYSEATAWFQKAANKEPLVSWDNVTVARYSLGACYYAGEGVPKDLVQAYKWWNLAAAIGHTNASTWRDIAARQMTQDQIADAQRLCRQFKSRGTHDPTSSGQQAIDEEPTATGTGFFISEDGFLVTCAHVIGGAKKVRLLTSAGSIAASVARVDTGSDLALLKAKGRFTALPVATSRTIKLGTSASTVGFPNLGLQGYSPKLSRGQIAALAGPADDPHFFQISLPIQPGNSGGALLDDRANVVGVVSAKLSARAALESTGALPENVNYAIKSS